MKREKKPMKKILITSFTIQFVVEVKKGQVAFETQPLTSF